MLFTNFSSAQTFGFAMSSLFLSRWCHCGFPKSSGFHFFEVCTTKPLFLLMTIVKESCSIMADSATPKTVVCQASLYMEFSGQEYWSGLLFPSLGDRPDTGIKPRSPALQVNSLPSVPPGKPKNSRVGNLSLLQVIVPSQGSSRGLLCCRRILYELSSWPDRW